MILVWTYSVDIFNILPGFLWQPLLNGHKSARKPHKKEETGNLFKARLADFYLNPLHS